MVKSNTFYSFLLLIFVFNSDISHATDVDLLWKARGLKANEKLEVLIKKNGESKGTNLSKSEICEWTLENAFLAHMVPDLQKIARQKIKDQTIYRMIFQKNGTIYAQVNVNYTGKEGTPSAVNVVEISNGARATFLRGMSETLLVGFDSCVIQIPMQDPITSSSLSSPL